MCCLVLKEGKGKGGEEIGRGWEKEDPPQKKKLQKQERRNEGI